MEKRVSSLANTLSNKVGITCLIVFIFFAKTTTLSAQDRALGNGKKYTIGEIKVTGNSTFNENTVIAYTGLHTGDQIYLPGDRISAIVKKLWKLKLFSDINFYITKIEGDTADLELEVKQVPELAEVRIDGVKKSRQADYIKDNELKKGAKVTENLITTTQNYISNKYRKEGFFNTKVLINTTPVKDTIEESNNVNMLVRVDKGERVKVSTLNFIGNEQLTDRNLRNAMKNTKIIRPLRFYKRSKYIKADYEDDKTKIVEKYKEKGYRDARVTKDSLYTDSNNNIALDIHIEEGNKHYLGDIKFIGNSIFTEAQLAKKLVLKKGDVYNGVLLEKRIADNTKPDGDDLTNLYQNNGYLFSSINAVETNVQNDTIDFEIRIIEGKLAHFNNITVTGNNKTNDHVIYRELRTKPGQQYSKEQVVRTVRELGQLGYFDAEQLKPEFKNVDPNSGTLDINYDVVERGASQIELQGGYGGNGFVGTLGLSFNNFSIRNIFKGEAYRPLPMGDGQKLNLRAQASTLFRVYSLSFTEPWLGGKKPFQLSTSLSHSTYFSTNDGNQFSQGIIRSSDVDRDRKFSITGISVGIAQRLKWPDNYFTLSHTISLDRYNFKNYVTGFFPFSDGFSNNLGYTLGLSRDNTFTNPIFPTGGSKFSLVAKMTFPYSLFNGVDYGAIRSEIESLETSTIAADKQREEELWKERLNWQEYYKIKFKADWYTRMVGKLVLKTSANFGFIGAYNNDRGVPPLERFSLGGSGLGASQFSGRGETVGLRGYRDDSVQPRGLIEPINNTTRATIYNKYSLEMRYPITLKPAASIFALAFLEGGASFNSFRSFNPFQLNRSAGVGLRIFMPAFGLLGIDFAYGLDPIPGLDNGPNGWETHFIIGQQF